jgi:hypothetical protein
MEQRDYFEKLIDTLEKVKALFFAIKQGLEQASCCEEQLRNLALLGDDLIENAKTQAGALRLAASVPTSPVSIH